MPRINGKIYYNNLTGDVLLVLNQNEGAWLRETTFQEDVAIHPQLKELSGDVISVIRLAWDQHKQDLAVSRPVKVEDGKVLWVPFDAFPEQQAGVSMSEQIKALKNENKALQLQNKALLERADFVDDTLQDVILALFE